MGHEKTCRKRTLEVIYSNSQVKMELLQIWKYFSWAFSNWESVGVLQGWRTYSCCSFSRVNHPEALKVIMSNISVISKSKIDARWRKRLLLHHCFHARILRTLEVEAGRWERWEIAPIPLVSLTLISESLFLQTFRMYVVVFPQRTPPIPS